MLQSIYGRAGYKLLLVSKASKILQDVMKAAVINQGDVNVQQLANGGFIADFVIGYRAHTWRTSPSSPWSRRTHAATSRDNGASTSTEARARPSRTSRSIPCRRAS